MKKPSRSRRGAIREHLSYANVAATIAVVLSMSGGALAATHYLIHSTKQISPAVLKKLHGARGSRGPSGSIGPIGPQGPTGLTGPKGSRGPVGLDGYSALTPLPSGSTESGDFSIAGPGVEKGETISGAISLPIPLAATIAADHVIFTSPAVPVEPSCPGPSRAARGFLCIYTAAAGVEKPALANPEQAPAPAGSGHFGFTLSWTLSEKAPPPASGTYSVTAG